MKICLLTIHVGANFGSVLQTYATSYVLQHLGNEVDILNYIPPRMSVKGFVQCRHGLKRKLIAIAGLPVMAINRFIYGGFLKRHLHLTRPYYNGRIKNMDDYDIYITGSDQVWNSIHNQSIDGMYYWEFLPKDKKRIAYASSFGQETLSMDEEIRIKPWLQAYSALSVREASGINILNHMGIRGATQLIDPTFMLNADEWKKELIGHKLINKPYLLMYTPYNIENRALLYSSAKKIAKQKKLKIVTFGWDIRKEPLADETRLFSSPKDFLSLMYYADFVITNSFHGTAFSINLNKQFFVFQPSAFSTRINNILELTGLQHRIMSTTPSNDSINEIIHYDSINATIESERLKSEKFLINALETKYSDVLNI